MKHHFSSLAVALIVSAVFLGTSAFQGQKGSQAEPVRSCLHKANDLVSRDGMAKFTEKKPITPIYKVPAGKWFVLTDFNLEILSGYESADPSLIQRKDGKDVERIHWVFLQRSRHKDYWSATAPLGNPTTGLVFPPKALLMLRSRDKKPNPSEYAYHFRGYLTDQ